MLPNAILLLLCSLAVADDEPYCDPSYIQGVGPAEYTLEPTSNKLTCNNNKIIEYEKKRFYHLKCDDTGASRWKGVERGESSELLLSPPVKADEKLNIKCIDAGPPTCVQSLVQGPAGEFTFDSSKKELTCTDGKAIEYNKQRLSFIKCNDVKGWLRGSKPLNPPVKADEKIDIQCVVACHKSLIAGFDENKMELADSSLKCKASEETTMYMDGGKEHIQRLLFCRPGEFWSFYRNSSKVNTTIKDIDTFTAACVIRDCHELLVSLGEGVKRENNKITCVNTEGKLQIDNEPTKYSEITCVPEEMWTSGEEFTSRAGFEEFSVECDKQPTTTTTTTLAPAPGNSGAYKGEAPQVSTILLVVCCAALGRNFM